MRKDMAKVIVERPRRGSSSPNYIKGRKGYKKKLQKEGLDCIQKESMAKNRQFGYDSKELNEHLSPLKRYLMKQVGRPWDKVFSDICENIRLDSAVQSHVRDHVFDFVVTNVIEEDGELYVKSRFFGLIPLENSYELLYVCPKTGLLKKVKQKEKVKYKRENLGVEISGNTYIRINGVWYEVELAETFDEAYDVIFATSYYTRHTTLRTMKYYYTAKGQWKHGQYAKSKRQLNSREIKFLGLNEYNEKEHANITVIRDGNHLIIKRGIYANHAN